MMPRSFNMGKLVRWLITESVRREMELEPKRFHRQTQEVRKWRLEVIQRLCYELVLAKQKSVFCTAYADDAIGAFFNGDWEEVKKLIRMIDPEQDGGKYMGSKEQLAHLVPFIDILKISISEVKA